MMPRDDTNYVIGCLLVIILLLAAITVMLGHALYKTGLLT